MNTLWLKAWDMLQLRTQLHHLSAQQVRSTFLEYFMDRGHAYVPSSSVVPEDDRSVTFVSAGMNQFKSVFLGLKCVDGKLNGSQNVVNWQKCIRAGGKHNDFDDIGRDLTHHTFFEMLGNFSFGGYSKAEACLYAWNFLTDVLKIPADRLYVTYFGGDKKMNLAEDRECHNIWVETGIPEEHILPFGSDHNFWEMAETGPCGPCAEIHYDFIGSRNARESVNCNDPTVVEIWNLVFMQFNRDVSAKVTALPSLCIDCGMGLERLVSIIQGVRSTYDTDLFIPLIKAIQKCCKAKEYAGEVGQSDAYGIDRAYRIVADHLRAACIMISDGVEPGSRNRGYQLRRVLRRAALNFSQILGAERETLVSLVPYFTKHMALLYDNVAAFENVIANTVISEEQLFWKSYDKAIKQLQNNAISYSHTVPGEDAWILLSKYGLPLEHTQRLCGEMGLEVDMEGFKQCLTQLQRVQKAEDKPWKKVKLYGLNPTDDSNAYNYQRIGKENYDFPSSLGKIIELYNSDGKPINTLRSGETGCIIMDSTVFFAEQGGQLCDRGTLRDKSDNILFTISDAKKRNGCVIHIGEVADGMMLEKGLSVIQVIDSKRRFALMCGHTATHLLHFALKKVFGLPLRQMSSLIGPEKIYFDFNIPKEINDLEKVKEITDIVNEISASSFDVIVKYIPRNEVFSLPGNFSTSDISQAIAFGKMVRIVSIKSSLLLGEDIVEPCCGTHVANTGDIGKFVIIGQKSRGSGVYRICAATNLAAIKCIRTAENLYDELSCVLSKNDETFIKTWKFLEEFRKDLPLLSKAELYEMIKAVKKKNRQLNSKLHLRTAD